MAVHAHRASPTAHSEGTDTGAAGFDLDVSVVEVNENDATLLDATTADLFDLDIRMMPMPEIQGCNNNTDDGCSASCPSVGCSATCHCKS